MGLSPFLSNLFEIRGRGLLGRTRCIKGNTVPLSVATHRIAHPPATYCYYTGGGGAGLCVHPPVRTGARGGGSTPYHHPAGLRRVGGGVGRAGVPPYHPEGVRHRGAGPGLGLSGLPVGWGTTVPPCRLQAPRGGPHPWGGTCCPGSHFQDEGRGPAPPRLGAGRIAALLRGAASAQVGVLLLRTFFALAVVVPTLNHGRIGSSRILLRPWRR